MSLSDGDTVDIRREITTGQQRELMRRLRTPGSDAIDLPAYNRERLLAYVIRWSFVDARGEIAPITEGALDFLEPESFRELVAALDAHEESIAVEKKRRTVAPDSIPILQSVG